MSYDWWRGPEWNTAGDFFEKRSDIAEAYEKQNDIGLLNEVMQLFGLGSELSFLKYPDDIGAMNFFEPWFLDYVIPIGDDGAGNLIVQALTSERRGRIFFYDHDYHYGLADKVKEAIDAEGAHMFWEMLEEEALLPCADNFENMLDKLGAYHSHIMRMMADYRLAQP